MHDIKSTTEILKIAASQNLTEDILASPAAYIARAWNTFYSKKPAVKIGFTSNRDSDIRDCLLNKVRNDEKMLEDPFWNSINEKDACYKFVKQPVNILSTRKGAHTRSIYYNVPSNFNVYSRSGSKGPETSSLPEITHKNVDTHKFPPQDPNKPEDIIDSLENNARTPPKSPQAGGTSPTKLPKDFNKKFDNLCNLVANINATTERLDTAQNELKKQIESNKLAADTQFDTLKKDLEESKKANDGDIKSLFERCEELDKKTSPDLTGYITINEFNELQQQIADLKANLTVNAEDKEEIKKLVLQEIKEQESDDDDEDDEETERDLLAEYRLFRSEERKYRNEFNELKRRGCLEVTFLKTDPQDGYFIYGEGEELELRRISLYNDIKEKFFVRGKPRFYKTGSGMTEKSIAKVKIELVYERNSENKTADRWTRSHNILKERTKHKGKLVIVPALPDPLQEIFPVLNLWKKDGIITRSEITLYGDVFILINDGDSEKRDLMEMSSPASEEGKMLRADYEATCNKLYIRNPNLILEMRGVDVEYLQKLAAKSHFVNSSGYLSEMSEKWISSSK